MGFHSRLPKKKKKKGLDITHPFFFPQPYRIVTISKLSDLYRKP